MKKYTDLLETKKDEARMFERYYNNMGYAGIASVYNNEANLFEEIISILNENTVERANPEFCVCGHLDIIFYGQICDHCGKPVVLQNSGSEV